MSRIIRAADQGPTRKTDRRRGALARLLALPSPAQWAVAAAFGALQFAVS